MREDVPAAQRPRKTMRSRRSIIVWTSSAIVGGLLLLVTWLSLVAPYWTARRALKSIAVEAGYRGRPYVHYVGEIDYQIVNAVKNADRGAVHQEALRRLFGGKRQALSSLRAYTIAPDWLAPRRAHAYLMMQFCGPEAVPVLTKALNDEDEDVRLSAVYALGEMGGEAKDALPQLRALEGDKIRFGGPRKEVLNWAVTAIESAPANNRGTLHLRDMDIEVENTGTKAITAVCLDVGDTTLECAKIDAGDFKMRILRGRVADEAVLTFTLADGRKIERKIRWLEGLPKREIKGRCVMFKVNGDSGQVQVELR